MLLLGYVEGHDLASVLKLRMRLAEDEAALVFVQVPLTAPFAPPSSLPPLTSPAAPPP